MEVVVVYLVKSALSRRWGYNLGLRDSKLCVCIIDRRVGVKEYHVAMFPYF